MNDVHRRAIIVDGHCDTPYRLIDLLKRAFRSRAIRNRGQRKLLRGDLCTERNLGFRNYYVPQVPRVGLYPRQVTRYQQDTKQSADYRTRDSDDEAFVSHS